MARRATRWRRRRALRGDTIFALGAIALGLFVVGLKTGWTTSRRIEPFFIEEPGPDHEPV